MKIIVIVIISFVTLESEFASYECYNNASETNNVIISFNCDDESL